MQPFDAEAAAWLLSDAPLSAALGVVARDDAAAVLTKARPFASRPTAPTALAPAAHAADLIQDHFDVERSGKKSERPSGFPG